MLFVDLIDFTPYAEREDPELVRRLQTSFYATARRVVGQYGGVVEKYIGDAVMALFGAPVATETDALRCVRAGLELQRALSSLDGAPDADHDLRFRAGIATGEALVDVAAARHGGQAIVAGDVVNTAARLQAVAPPGGVLVCGQTRALTADAIRYAEQPPITLRGRSNLTEVWLAQAPAQRKEPEPDALPLVDRDHELSLLVNALNRTVENRQPQLVTIFGPAGIGKSRLVRELYRHSLRAGDAVAWCFGHCPPFGENVTYAALAEIIKFETGVLDNDSAPAAQARLRHTAGQVTGADEAERVAGALGPLVGLPSGELPAREAESIWRRFLVALAARRPTVLVFEDLHWADEPMLRFIELLAAGARDVPLLILTTSRPELIDRDPSWAGTIAGSFTITLLPLRSSGIATLYTELLGERLTTEMITPLVELADGNPLYAQEYVRMLIERGALPAAEGWPAGGVAQLPTPDSVHSVIANRVDLLDPVDRTILQAAAVVGMQFWPGAVAATLGRPGEPVEHSLLRLEQREFIVEQPESSVFGEREFRFRHVLVRDVCYQRLPRTERVARHERAADWLESLARHRNHDLAEVLAHHRWAALEIARTVGVPLQQHVVAARSALRRASQRAYQLHALEAAASYAERARSLFDPAPHARPPTGEGAAGAATGTPERVAGTPESAAGTPGRVAGTAAGAADCPGPPGGTAPAAAERERLCLELLLAEIAFYRDQAGFLAGDGLEQLASLADELCRAGADADAARAWTLLGQAAWLRGVRPAALSYLERAVALFEQLPDSSEKVDAYAELGRLHMLSFEREPAVAAAGVAAEIASRLGLAEAEAGAQITEATARYEAGDPHALDQLQTIMEFCRSRKLLALQRATQNLAMALLEEGQWARSIELVTTSQSTVQGGHNLATGYSTEALRAYKTGDLDAFVAAADAHADAPGGRWDVRMRGLRSFVRVLRREPPLCPDDVTEVLALARSSGFNRQLWVALGNAALCRALQGRPAEALALVGELTEDWQKVGVMASGAWVCAAAHAVAVAERGGDQPLGGRQGAAGLPETSLAEALAAALAGSLRRTRWGQAALHTANGAAALVAGAPATAAAEHLAAAAIYEAIPAMTDHAMSLALAAAAFTRAGDLDAAERARAQVRRFVERTGARALLRVAGDAPAEALRW